MSNKHTYSVPFSKEELAHAYLALGMSQAEIAKDFGTTQKVVWRAMGKFAIPRRVAAKRNQSRENNSSWKGKDATYKAMHMRMYSLFGRPMKCSVCGTTDATRSYDWANMSGHFDEPSDYKRMCRSCHWKHDKKILNIKHMRKEGCP